MIGWLQSDRKYFKEVKSMLREMKPIIVEPKHEDVEFWKSMLLAESQRHRETVIQLQECKHTKMKLLKRYLELDKRYRQLKREISDEPKTDIEALQEIIKALPIKVGDIYWK